MRLRRSNRERETLRLTPGETVELRHRSPERFEVERSCAPGEKPPPAHYHPAQDEVFEVIEGTLSARVAGDRLDLDQGDVLEIPLGTSHQIWNAGKKPTRARWE